MRARKISAEGKNKAYVFDFDDVLIKSSAVVRVFRNHKLIKELTPSEYNTFIVRPEDILDFSDFDDPRLIMEAKPYKMMPVIQTISRAISEGRSTSSLYVLTARHSSVKIVIHQKLQEEGVMIPIENIITVGGDENFNIAVEKKKILRKLSQQHNRITFFDDNEKNIHQAKSVPGIDTRLIEKII